VICLLNDITAVPITKLFCDCSVRTVVPITKRVVECSVVCLLLQVINCHAIIGNENTRFCSGHAKHGSLWAELRNKHKQFAVTLSSKIELRRIVCSNKHT